ncbi:MAG: GAF domain-containing protein [Chlorobi bacterium]|nr:GAF domain-containing protein [Chlorobiota bacterium]
MRFKFGLKSKMLIFILVTSITIFIIAIGYISYIFKNISLKNAKQLSDTYAREYANLTKAKLNEYMLSARTLSSEIEAYYALPEEQRRPMFSDFLANVLKNNDDFISTWSICEPLTIDSLDNQYINKTGSTFAGNFSPTYYKDSGQIKIMASNDTVLFQGAYFTVPKSTGKETILDPYYYSYTGNENDAVLETNLIVPIRNKNSEFIGVVGIDVTLKKLSTIFQKIKPFNKGYAYLISNNGTIVTYPDEKLVGKFIDSIPNFNNFPSDAKTKIKKGEKFSFILKDKNKIGKEYITISPISVGKVNTPWAIAVSVPVKTIMQKANKSFSYAIFIGIAGLALLTIVIWLIAGNITRPILKTTNLLEKLSKGEINKNDILSINSNDEIGEMANSVNTLIHSLVNTAGFATEIGNGNLDVEFSLLSENDILGKSLLEMRENLILAKKEEEIGKKEDQKRNWATQGMAKFGELLRDNKENIEELAFHLIKTLIKYVDASQCAFFILNNDIPTEIFLELKATIAFGRRKFIKKRVVFGETLIGRAAEERKTITVSNLPENYISIIKGVSGENPKNLLIVPLQVNDEVFGVIELISYHSFEDYQIEFIEKIGESIASTIAGVKINIRTNQLLEQSKKQADELAQQEEEMRQNMEEMQATQEEAAKREAEMKGLMNGINSRMLVAEYDLDGQLIEINEELLNLYGTVRQKVIGKYREEFDTGVHLNQEEKDLLWNDLRNGKTRKRIHHLIINNKDIWLNEIYTPVFDNSGNPIKILNISTDITEMYKTQNEIELIEEEIKEIQANN